MREGNGRGGEYPAAYRPVVLGPLIRPSTPPPRLTVPCPTTGSMEYMAYATIPLVACADANDKADPLISPSPQMTALWLVTRISTFCTLDP